MPNIVSTRNAPMNAPTKPPTVLFGLNGDNGLRAQRKRRNPFPPHQAATSAAEAAKATRKVSGHTITRWASDQQIRHRTERR